MAPVALCEGSCHTPEQRSPAQLAFPRGGRRRHSGRHNGKDQGEALVRATLMYGAGDVRVENVPDPVLREPADAVVRVLRSCVCGSDLWPYGAMPAAEQGRRMGHGVGATGCLISV